MHIDIKSIFNSMISGSEIPRSIIK